jgi:hypothetical protein
LDSATKLFNNAGIRAAGIEPIADRARTIQLLYDGRFS